MRSRFHEQAAGDLDEDVRYYNDASPGLGLQFLAEARAAVKLLERHPRLGTVVADEIRAKHLIRFPHTLLYALDEDEVVILAVAHQRQDLSRWIEIVRSRQTGA